MRDVTTVAPQALALLNNSFSHEQSTALAGRIASLAKSPVEQVKVAWRFALGREAAPQELSLATAHMKKQSAEFKEGRATSRAVAWRTSDAGIPTRDLVLHLRADVRVVADESGRVSKWSDQSPAGHDATQAKSGQRPLLVRSGKGRSIIRFDGRQRFLDVDGKLLKTPVLHLRCGF